MWRLEVVVNRALERTCVRGVGGDACVCVIMREIVVGVRHRASSDSFACSLVLPCVVAGSSIPPVDPADIGRSAARVLADLGVGHEGKSYEISGPARLTYPDMAAVLTKVCGCRL